MSQSSVNTMLLTIFAVVLVLALGVNSCTYKLLVAPKQQHEQQHEQQHDLRELSKRVLDLESDLRVLKEISHGAASATPTW